MSNNQSNSSAKIKTDYKKTNKHRNQIISRNNIIGGVIGLFSSIPFAYGFHYAGAILVLIGSGIILYGHIKNLILAIVMFVLFALITSFAYIYKGKQPTPGKTSLTSIPRADSTITKKPPKKPTPVIPRRNLKPDITQNDQKENTPQPPQPININWLYRQVSSIKPEYPFSIEIVMQTNVTIESPHFVIVFDDTICDGEFHYPGGNLYTMKGFRLGPKACEFFCQTPSFSPTKPLIVTIFSKNKITPVKIMQKPSLY